jgi:hypothetical protein
MTCKGCGATIDFSLPEGTVSTQTTQTTEVVGYDSVWGGYYGYQPYGYYDPFDPFVDAMAFSLLCIALW